MSSEPQAERESLHDQSRLNREFIENIGRQYAGYTAELVAELQVVGSRSIVDLADAEAAYPEGYGELVRLVKAREIDAVVCRSRDRLGRVDSLIITVERLCWKYDVIVISRQSLPMTLDVRSLREGEGAGLVAGIESHLARSTVRRLVNENEMGMIARVRRGNFANHLPYGYKKAYSPSGAPSVEIDPAAAAVIRYALLDLYLGQKWGTPRIARYLTEQGYPAPIGKEWSGTSLLKMICRVDRYAGYVEVNRESKKNRPYIKAEANHAAIFTRQESAAIEAEHNSRSVKHVHGRGVLHGVVFCTNTGRPLSFFEQGGHFYYRCHTCHAAGRSHGKAEAKLLTAIESLIDELAQMVDPAAVLAERNAPEVERLEGEVARLDVEREKLDKKRGRVLHAYVYKDASSLDFDAEMGRLTQAIQECDRSLLECRRALDALRDQDATQKKMEAVRNAGRRMLARVEDEPELVREWLRSSLRVYVSRESIDRIEII